MYMDQRGMDGSRFGGADPQLEQSEATGHWASHTEVERGRASVQILQRRDSEEGSRRTALGGPEQEEAALELPVEGGRR